MKKSTQQRSYILTAPFKKNLSFLPRLLLCLLLFITSFVHAQDPPQYGTPYANVPDPRDVNLYQVHIRPYSAAGNLQGVIARLDSIKSLGINVIYVMPIYPHGTDSRSSASPYCIKDFKSVASEYGTLTDFRNLVDGAHSRGMAVILDIAINGTSWDHPWITQHPDWYNQSGGVIQQLASFPDIAALNFSNTSMRAALVDAMRYWIFAANIDGYRCDFANNPPLDFWTNTINNLRGITTHKLLMLAEGDRLQNFQTGFDYNFGDKWYYDAIQPIAQNGTSVSQIQTTTNTEYTYATGSQQEVRYTSNHDIETTTTALNVFGGHNGVVVNFLISAYMRGVPFLTSGQETDFNQTIPWPYQSVKINWNTNPSASTDFRKILNYRTSSTAIRRGTMTNYSDNNVCAFTKINGSEKVVVMANLRNSTQNYTIPSAFAGSYKDAFTGASVTLTSGATQSLSAFGYRVLTNGGTSCTPTPITPYLQINSGAWQQTATASLAVGGTINLGPQPLDGTWSWTGPNNFTSSSRQISITNIQSNQAGNYVATYTNTSGCSSTQTFSITVTGGCTPTPIIPYLQVNGGGWQQTATASLASGGTIDFGPQPLNGTWSWTGPNNFSSSSRQFTITNIQSNQGGNYVATYTNTSGCNSTQTFSITVTGGTVTTYYNIQNRWHPEYYLYDGGNGQVKYGTNPGSNTLYQWTKVATGSYVLLKNRSTGNLMHVENQNGSVQCSTGDPTWYSAQWTLADAGSGYSYIENRWQSGELIHIENLLGYAQYANPQAGWYSAEWQFVNGTNVSGAVAARLPMNNVDIIVYPNPVTGKQFHIEIPSLQQNEKAVLTITNSNGKTVSIKIISSAQTTIDNSLAAGVYFIKVSAINLISTGSLLFSNSNALLI